MEDDSNHDSYPWYSSTWTAFNPKAVAAAAMPDHEYAIALLTRFYFQLGTFRATSPAAAFELANQSEELLGMGLLCHQCSGVNGSPDDPILVIVETDGQDTHEEEH